MSKDSNIRHLLSTELGELKNVDLSLPKFKFTWKKELQQILSKLGLGKIFSAGKNEFMEISDQEQLRVSKVIHQASIEVNENGTEAAAATVIAMMRSSLFTKPGDTKHIIVDKPFGFWIVKKNNMAVMFSGKIVDPVYG